MSDETDVDTDEDPTVAIAKRLGAALRERGATIGIVESLTGGLLVQALARAGGMFPGAWDPISIMSIGSLVVIDRAAIPNVVHAEYPGVRSHPYEKPPAVWNYLFARIPPTTVLDPYAGSCTSADAARRHGHQRVGIEADRRHVDAAVRRWESILPEVG